MSLDAYRDASLLALFQMEAKAQTDTLTASLLELERDPTQSDHLEACMRAAHSLKGAARIVDLMSAVPIAHVMEDCLVAAQKGTLRLQPRHIDVLLQGSDLLLHLSQMPENGAVTPFAASELDAYVTRVRQLMGESQGSAGVAAQTPRKPADIVPSVPAETVEAAAPAAPAETVGADTMPLTDSTMPGEHDATLAATPPAPGAGKAASMRAEQPTAVPRSASSDRALRLSSNVLTNLLGLASETMVESRWLAPFSKSLFDLKRQHSEMMSVLDQVYFDLRDQDVAPQTAELIRDLRKRAAHVQSALADRADGLESFDWRLTHVSQRLYDTALSCRMRPLRDGVSAMPRMVRDLGREIGKTVRLELVGERTHVDRDILDTLDAPLTHLLRNAVDHGIESPERRRALGKPEEGCITLSARHHAGRLIVEIADDGAGIDLENLRAEVVRRGLATPDTASQLQEAELLEFLFLPGFSTRKEVTHTSGRGVGLDAVQSVVRTLHGELTVSQHAGAGTRFSLSLPLSLSVIRVLLVDVGLETYAIPLAFVAQVLSVERRAIHHVRGQPHFQYRGRATGLVLASQILQTRANVLENDPAVRLVILGEGEQACGLAVDRFLGERSLVVQPLDARLGKVQDIACGAILENGTPVLVLDAEDLLQSMHKRLQANPAIPQVRGVAGGTTRKRILVVDDSLTVRELQRKLLSHRGYEVSAAVDGADGWNMLRAEAFDLLISDIDMPRMDGIELVTLLKRDARLAHIPVMIVSYKDRAEDRQRGLDAGADFYLAKCNFHDDTLLSAVEDLIGKPEQ